MFQDQSLIPYKAVMRCLILVGHETSADTFLMHHFRMANILHWIVPLLRLVFLVPLRHEFQVLLDSMCSKGRALIHFMSL